MREMRLQTVVKVLATIRITKPDRMEVDNVTSSVNNFTVRKMLVKQRLWQRFCYLDVWFWGLLPLVWCYGLVVRTSISTDTKLAEPNGGYSYLKLISCGYAHAGFCQEYGTRHMWKTGVQWRDILFLSGGLSNVRELFLSVNCREMYLTLTRSLNLDRPISPITNEPSESSTLIKSNAYRSKNAVHSLVLLSNLRSSSLFWRKLVDSCRRHHFSTETLCRVFVSFAVGLSKTVLWVNGLRFRIALFGSVICGRVFFLFWLRGQ